MKLKKKKRVKNIIIIFFHIDVTVSVRVNRSAMCNLLHPLYCACLHNGKRPDIAASKMARLYQQAAKSLVASKR